MVATRRAYQAREPRLLMPGTPSGRAQTRVERAAHRRRHLRSHRPNRPRPDQLATRPTPETHRMSGTTLRASARARSQAAAPTRANGMVTIREVAVTVRR